MIKIVGIQSGKILIESEEPLKNFEILKFEQEGGITGYLMVVDINVKKNVTKATCKLLSTFIGNTRIDEFISINAKITKVDNIEDVYGYSLGKHYKTNFPYIVNLKSFRELKEAYHYVILGLSGSGKSRLAMEIVRGYSQTDTSIIVIDSVGEWQKFFDWEVIKLSDVSFFSPRFFGKLARAVGLFEVIGLNSEKELRKAIEFIESKLQFAMDVL